MNIYYDFAFSQLVKYVKIPPVSWAAQTGDQMDSSSPAILYSVFDTGQLTSS